MLCLYDHDAGGERAYRKVESGFAQYASHVHVERLGLTLDQVTSWELPTRPAKRSDPEAAKWGDRPAVELDAAPPERLSALIENAIQDMIDPHAWKIAQATEEEEREGLLQLVRGLEA